jgi:hypothetical protein
VSRYVAEVSASAMAVEQQAREGGLDLQRNRTEETEEWDEEEEEEGGVEDEEAEEEVEAEGSAEQAAASDDCDTETAKGSEQGVECNTEGGGSSQEASAEEAVRDRPALLREVREVLEEAQEEAASLLGSIQQDQLQ